MAAFLAGFKDNKDALHHNKKLCRDFTLQSFRIF
jgi:hypothetical protein